MKNRWNMPPCVSAPETVAGESRGSYPPALVNPLQAINASGLERVRSLFEAANEERYESAETIDCLEAASPVAESMNGPLPDEGKEAAQKQEIQSMRAYIEDRYGDRLIRRLADRINKGEIDLRNHEPCYARADEIQINDMYFTRTSGYTIHADVYYDVKLFSRGALWEQWVQREFRGCFDVYIFEDEPTEIEFGYDYLSSRRYRTVRGVALDDYWVPFYRAGDVETAAENILQENCPEMLLEPNSIKARELADALGLKILILPLHRKKKTASILFFSEGEVTVHDENNQPYKRHVSGKTIVLNSYFEGKPKAAELAIFHECFHYVEHYPFFRGQRMCDNDLARFAPWKKEKDESRTATGAQGERRKTTKQKKRRQANPIRYLEWQANRASYCMMMPGSLVRPRLRAGLDRLSQTGYHAGKKLDVVCRELAEEFSAPKYCARYRAITMGYTAAKGALNYVGDKYIEPFAFSLDSCRGDYTFVVSAKEVIREYVQNADFRNLLDHGNYVYVDGHMCVDDERFVVKQSCGPRLTRFANEHVDLCCLRFKVNYIVDEDESYTFGQLRSDAEYNERFMTYDSVTEAMGIGERASYYEKVIAELPTQPYKAIVQHMRNLAISENEMERVCGISESTIKRIRRGEKKTFTLDQIVMISLGMHLPPELSEDLIRRSKNAFLAAPDEDTPEAKEAYNQHMIYRILLRSFYLLPISEIQKKLQQEHLPLLEFSKAG